nr:serine hydrolase domain-containing protein [Pyrinomonadaceae bacterium]
MKTVFNAKSLRRKVATFSFGVSRRFILFAALLHCIFALSISATAQGLPLATPASVGMNAAKLDQIEALVNADIADKKLPGAVVIVGRKGKIVYRKAFGNRALVPTVEKMTVDTIFDVASLTKPVATATSIMILIEQGKLRLNDTVGKFFPEIADEQAKRITVLQLLTHVSGYRPDFDLGEKWSGQLGMLAALNREKLRNLVGTRFVYSDINFEVLGQIVHKVSGERLEDFVSKWARAAGMSDSGFIPFKPAGDSSEIFPVANLATAYRSRIAPTENVRGQNSYLGSTFTGDESSGNEILRGKVHDPTSFRMGGVAGHAGLFSTADDLARYAQMLLNGGVVPDWNGRAGRVGGTP